MVCRDALPTTSYPCRPASPVTPFRVRHDKRVLDPQDAPSTETAAARAGLPRLRAGSLPAGRHAPRCLTLCLPPFLSQYFFGSTRAASLLPSRPQCARGAARRPRQGRPAGPPARFGLDEVEHGARLAMSGGLAASRSCRDPRLEHRALRHDTAL